MEFDLAPITLIYGPNASAKSTIIQSLLLQKQSLESGALTLSGTYARLGSVAGLIYRHDESCPITVGFEFAVPVRWDMASEAVSPGVVRGMKLTFSADAAGSPALDAVELSIGERGFRFVPEPGRTMQAGGFRLTQR